MADHLGYRQKFGVLGPSTNTIVQPDFDDLRPVGVTNHYSRIAIPNDPVNDNESFLKLVDNINKATLEAIDVLRTCEMDYMIMGMSAATFWNGRKGAEGYIKMMEDRAQVVKVGLDDGVGRRSENAEFLSIPQMVGHVISSLCVVR